MSQSQTVLITGASGGIGYELAKVFAKEGFNLVLVARSTDKLNELKNKLQGFPVQVTIITKDLSLQSSPEELFKEIYEQKIEIDILVNNAGFGLFGEFKDTNWNKESQMINLNIYALTALTKLFLQPMLQRKRGKVLNIASTAAFQPGPLMSVYFASKAYVLHFSEAIAKELENTGITVTTLCPGATESGFQNAASMGKSKLFKRKLPSSEEVALFGYKALMRGERVAIHGLLNNLLAFGTRFLPRQLVTNMVLMMQSEE